MCLFSNLRDHLVWQECHTFPTQQPSLWPHSHECTVSWHVDYRTLRYNDWHTHTHTRTHRKDAKKKQPHFLIINSKRWIFCREENNPEPILLPDTSDDNHLSISMLVGSLLHPYTHSGPKPGQETGVKGSVWGPGGITIPGVCIICISWTFKTEISWDQALSQHSLKLVKKACYKRQTRMSFTGYSRRPQATQWDDGCSRSWSAV